MLSLLTYYGYDVQYITQDPLENREWEGGEISMIYGDSNNSPPWSDIIAERKLFTLSPLAPAGPGGPLGPGAPYEWKKNTIKSKCMLFLNYV